MKTSKLLPAGFAALVMIGAGAMVATAQTAPGQSGPEQSGPARPETGKVHPDRQMTGERPHPAHFRHGHGKPRGPGHHKGGDMFRTLFEAVDADKDGSVTREEIDTYRASRVSDADTSGDGALSIEEFDTLYREFTRSRMVDAFQKLDNDGDGMITAEEMDAQTNRLVGHLDHDGDGALTLKNGRKGG